MLNDLIVPRVIIIHGGQSYQNQEEYLQNLAQSEVRFNYEKSGWNIYLKNQLLEYAEVLLPKMPCSDNAKYSEWKQVFEKLEISSSDIVIGHSLGGIFLAKYFSENHKHIKQIHLVAPDYAEGDFVFHPELAHELEHNCHNNLHLWQSEDDFALPITGGLKYREVLKNYKPHFFTQKGHFLTSNFPELLVELMEILG